MKFTEYRKAAYRHLETCTCLLKNIENENCKKNKSQILTNIYYLSGYVIECSLKFVIFSAINFDRKQEIEDCTDFTWKEHNLDNLERIAKEKGVRFSADIPILGSEYKINENVKKLFRKRNDPKMQIRYSYNDKDLSFEILSEYILIIQDINKKLTNQYN